LYSLIAIVDPTVLHDAAELECLKAIGSEMDMDAA
jgi:hypothetical protein